MLELAEMSLKMQENGISKTNGKFRFLNPFQKELEYTGYCNVGNFGSDQRLTYTIIGGEVNIGRRLETAEKLGKISDEF